jgi:hypothetical protein
MSWFGSSGEEIVLWVALSVCVWALIGKFALWLLG